MEFYKILQEIMNEKNMSIPDVARATGLADSTIRSIISRKTKNISLDVAFKLSNGLNVSLERLNGECKSDIEKLSKKESKLLGFFKKLNSKGQDVAIERIDELGQIPKYKDEYITLAAHSKENGDVEGNNRDIEKIKKLIKEDKSR